MKKVDTRSKTFLQTKTGVTMRKPLNSKRNMYMILKKKGGRHFVQKEKPGFGRVVEDFHLSDGKA